jgi:hypothetical protein
VGLARIRLEQTLFDFWWDAHALHALDVPVETMPLSELAWQLRLKLWRHEGVPFAVSPSEVATDPVRYGKEYERMLTADLAYPIDLMLVRGRWTIMDGVHRLLKARLLGLDAVRVRKIPRSAIPLIERRAG